MREPGGVWIGVDDAAIMETRDAIAREEGLLLCPEGAAVPRNGSTGLKHPLPPMDKGLDWAAPLDPGRLP